MTWERKILLADLLRAAGTTDQDQLMNWMQERGLVADEAVTLADVPTIDLLRAKNAAEARKPRLLKP